MERSEWTQESIGKLNRELGDESAMEREAIEDDVRTSGEFDKAGCIS